MGLFDTFIIESSILCKECNMELSSVQSKAFGQSLETYEPGALVRYSNIITGIVEEELYCRNCSGKKERLKNIVYILIWHNVYVGTYSNEVDAIEKMKSIDRLNILEWLDNTQNEKELWQRRYNNLLSDLKSWHDYIKSDDKEAFLKKPLFITNLKEYLENKDPLDALIKKNSYRIKNAADEMFE